MQLTCTILGCLVKAPRFTALELERLVCGIQGFAFIFTAVAAVNVLIFVVIPLTAVSLLILAALILMLH